MRNNVPYIDKKAWVDTCILSRTCLGTVDLWHQGVYVLKLPDFEPWFCLKKCRWEDLCSCGSCSVSVVSELLWPSCLQSVTLNDLLHVFYFSDGRKALWDGVSHSDCAMWPQDATWQSVKTIRLWPSIGRWPRWMPLPSCWDSPRSGQGHDLSAGGLLKLSSMSFMNYAKESRRGCCFPTSTSLSVAVFLQDDRKFSEARGEGMGKADIKYGDSLVYAQHVKSRMWLSYQTFETKKRGVGRVEEKKVQKK